MNAEIYRHAWGIEHLAQALEALGRRAGLAPAAAELPPPPGSAETLGRWIEAAAGVLGLEAEPVETSYAEAERMVLRSGPALLRLPDSGPPRLLAVLGPGRGRRVRLLGPDLRLWRLPAGAVLDALCRPIEADAAPAVERLLEEAGVPARRRRRSLQAVLRGSLGPKRIGGCWLLRLPPGAGFARQLREAGLFRRLALLLGAHAAEFMLWIGAWWMLGRSALQGRFDRGWLLAWTLVLLTIVPLRLLGAWLQGRIAVGAGGLFKRRLLDGALSLEPEAIRLEGVGGLLGRVIEADAVESLALGGGFLGLAALLELALAALVLSAGAGGLLHCGLLAAWVLAAAALGWQNFLRRSRWTGERLEMTEDLVERMVGHRTRLAQEPREIWHEGEDQALERYLTASSELDRSTAGLEALVPRGWLVLAVAALAPAFVLGRAEAAPLAVALGGILLAEGGLTRLAAGVTALVSSAVAWDKVAPLFRASGSGAVRRSTARAALAVAAAPPARGPVLLEAHELVFRYRSRGEPVLRGCSLKVRPAERLLLEGPSGGGKSALAAVLSGLREPDSGLLLLDGLDRGTLGPEGWRRRVAAAPQFHENHVLTETFAFNLLLGRGWPPEQTELDEAERLCRELGLGELLHRMPAGLLQMVGESGWQLSHGERSRLYIARTLLQGAELLVLDESFAALDPENLRRALRCVLERAPSLMVIAHP